MKTMNLLLILILLAGCTNTKAECKSNKPPIKIAVIDSGFGYEGKGRGAKLCKFGHKDFSIDRQFTNDFYTETPVPLDVHGHGTNVTGLIDEYARRGNVNYCIVVLKYYSENQSEIQNTLYSSDAISYATNLKVDYINYSGGGPKVGMQEKLAVMKFLNEGGKFVAAAGNEGEDLDNPETDGYYPAMADPRITVVGNKNLFGVRYPSSNWGKMVNRWEVGEKVEVYGITMTGTSQATAVATGKIVSESDNKCDIGY